MEVIIDQIDKFSNDLVCDKEEGTMLIGREKERRILQEATARDESRLIAVYGRRRIGKTYLIREVFQNS